VSSLEAFRFGKALSDDRNRLLEPLIPPPKCGRPALRTTDMRILLDNLFFVMGDGCRWCHPPSSSMGDPAAWASALNRQQYQGLVSGAPELALKAPDNLSLDRGQKMGPLPSVWPFKEMFPLDGGTRVDPLFPARAVNPCSRGWARTSSPAPCSVTQDGSYASTIQMSVPVNCQLYASLGDAGEEADQREAEARSGQGPVDGVEDTARTVEREPVRRYRSERGENMSTIRTYLESHGDSLYKASPARLTMSGPSGSTG
jgi:hypothetical protein